MWGASMVQGVTVNHVFAGSSPAPTARMRGFMKIKIGLFLFVAMVLIWAFIFFNLDHKNKDRGDRQNVVLKQYYLADNDVYFNRVLPKDADVQWGDIPLEDGVYVMGRTDFWPGTGKLSIVIDRRSNVTTSQALFTLFHEECHAQNYVRGVEISEDDKISHGPEFQKCMKNLAAVGAFKDVW